ncbi:MAG: SanA protein [Ruminococcaceae bacterium]|nr:SanA protein [Oscillospiraceae bacterium]
MKKFLLIAVSVIAAIAMVFSILNIAVLLRTDGSVQALDSLENEKFDCILVLGAGLRSDGSPSDMLEDRLKVAVELYRKGASDTLVLSGDCSGDHYDEVRSMKKYCLENGVDEADIICDNFGFSTYESVYNLRKSEEYSKVLIVTQRYHLYRAIYIAEEMDFEAYGMSASLRSYRGQLFRDLREGFARVKDFFQVMFY